MDKTEIKEAFSEFLASPEGEKQIGEIMLKAVNIALDVEVDVEEFDKDRMLHVAKKKKMNVLRFLAGYLPHLEGKMLGVQEDANKTRNAMGSLARLAISNQRPKRSALFWKRSKE